MTETPSPVPGSPAAAATPLPAATPAPATGPTTLLGASAPAPADYELTLPEGFSADDETTAAFKALAAENGFSRETAQKLVDLQTGLMARHGQRQTEITSQWARESRADKEFGGAAFDRSVGEARAALKAFASPELRAFLNDSGLGNHPELIRAFVRVGRAMAEDGRVAAGRAPGRDPLAKLYPTMFKE